MFTFWPWVLGLSLGVLIVRGAIRAEQAWQDWRRVQRELAWYRQTYRRRQGWTAGFGPYELVSVDAGLHWYEKRGGVLEAVRPRLLEQLDGFDQLVRTARTRGAPLLSDPARLDEDQRMLEQAGFQVERRGEQGWPN